VSSNGETQPDDAVWRSYTNSPLGKAIWADEYREVYSIPHDLVSYYDNREAAELVARIAEIAYKAGQSNQRLKDVFHFHLSND